MAGKRPSYYRCFEGVGLYNCILPSVALCESIMVLDVLCDPKKGLKKGSSHGLAYSTEAGRGLPVSAMKIVPLSSRDLGIPFPNDSRKKPYYEMGDCASWKGFGIISTPEHTGQWLAHKSSGLHAPVQLTRVRRVIGIPFTHNGGAPPGRHTTGHNALFAQQIHFAVDLFARPIVGMCMRYHKGPISQ